MIEIVTEILNIVGFILLAFVPSMIIMLVLAVVIFALLESNVKHTAILVFLCIGGMAASLTFFLLLSKWVFL